MVDHTILFLFKTNHKQKFVIECVNLYSMYLEHFISGDVKKSKIFKIGGFNYEKI